MRPSTPTPAAFAEAEALLHADANWQKLTPEDKHAIRADNGLLPVPRPSVASPEDIVAALPREASSAWADLTRGLKAGAQAALDEAAERLQPQVQPITLPAPGTLQRCRHQWRRGSTACAPPFSPPSPKALSVPASEPKARNDARSLPRPSPQPGKHDQVRPSGGGSRGGGRAAPARRGGGGVARASAKHRRAERNRLRAHARSLGDRLNKDGTHDIAD